MTKSVRLWKTEYGSSAEMSCKEIPEDLILFTPTRGGYHSVTRDDYQAKPGQMLCIYPSPPGTWIIPGDTVMEGVAISNLLITSRLKMLIGGKLSHKLEFKPVMEAQSCAVRSVRLAALALITATEHQDLNLDGGTIQSLSSALIDLVLEMLPNSYSDRLRRPVPRVSPRQVRRAIAYIRDNPLPVKNIDELAVICGVSARSLQSSFRNTLGMGPAAYWRSVRLERAMEQLRQFPSENISRVALEWGFTNVTRFRALSGLPRD